MSLFWALSVSMEGNCLWLQVWLPIPLHIGLFIVPRREREKSILSFSIVFAFLSNLFWLGFGHSFLPFYPKAISFLYIILCDIMVLVWYVLLSKRPKKSKQQERTGGKKKNLDGFSERNQRERSPALRFCFFRRYDRPLDKILLQLFILKKDLGNRRT